MNQGGWRITVILSVLLAWCGAGRAAAPLPVEAFAALPAIDLVDMNPAGTLLVSADQSGAVPAIEIFDIAARKVRNRFTIGADMKLRSLAWSDDETLLVTLSLTYDKQTIGKRAYEIWRTLAVNTTTGSRNFLLMSGGARALVTSAELIAWHGTRPGSVVMSTWDYSVVSERAELGTHIERKRGDSGWLNFLYEVDTRSGQGTQLEQGTQFTDQWVVDHRGHCVARSEWKPETSTYSVLAKNGAAWRTIHTRQDGSELSLDGVSDDGAAVVALGANSAGRRIAWLLPLNGEPMKPFYEDPDHDVTGIIRDNIDDRILGLSLGGIERSVHWLDEAAQTRAATIARAFKDRHTEDWGHSQDGKRVLVRAVGAAHPAMYYLVDFDRHSADIVGDEYPRLSDAVLGPVRAYSYAARDGTKIPAYLTLPAGAAVKNLPLVVLPHGGPASNDDAYEFDYWSQFLASRGYAVLQPQFRGSTGYGEAFRLAGHHQWGLLMQDDVTDGVKDAIAQGIADPKRICIVGGSYGGYAALAGAAFTPELYKCAVSVSGVSNLPEMLGWIKGRTSKESDSVAYWLENVGSAFDKNVIERSPALAAERIRAPILLLHGVDDTVVPIAQSEDMARALAEQEKTCKFVRLPGEDHWLSRAPTRLQVLREIETFLHDNL